MPPSNEVCQICGSPLHEETAYRFCRDCREDGEGMIDPLEVRDLNDPGTESIGRPGLPNQYSELMEDLE